MNSNVPTLHTARLTLRPHRAGDLDACAAMWANPAVTRYIGGRPSGRNETWMRILRYAGLWSILGYGYWAIEERASRTFVGDLGFADFHRELVPAIDGIPEAGWTLDPAFYGRGYATEALLAALGWLDANLDCDRSACMIVPANVASSRVAEKAGYREKARTVYKDEPVMLLMRRNSSR